MLFYYYYAGDWSWRFTRLSKKNKKEEADYDYDYDCDGDDNEHSVLRYPNKKYTEYDCVDKCCCAQTQMCEMTITTRYYHDDRSYRILMTTVTYA
jgi:hypothetical protein